MKFLLSCTLLLLLSNSLQAGETTVELKQNKDTVAVSIGGEEFAVYNFSSKLPKPFFFPVRGAGGTILTRAIEQKGDDHPHHKGIWVAIDEVNEVRFWAEKGKILNIAVKPIVVKGNPAKLQVVNQWLGIDGTPIVTETTVIGIYPNRLLTYDITFTAGAEQVTFDDTKEGLFGFRMVASMREKDGGHVVNADGLKGTGECWGKPSAWVDYYGQVDGKTYGVALFDHPQNFRPSRYHVRNYGLFSVSPFCQKSYTGGKKEALPHVLKPKTSLRLRYGLYIHSGNTSEGRVAETYRQFVEAAD